MAPALYDPGINVPGVNFGQLEPQKNAFFSHFGSDLQENGEFWRSKCFLEVAVKFKELQFTFSELARPGKALEDTG